MFVVREMTSDLPLATDLYTPPLCLPPGVLFPPTSQHLQPNWILSPSDLGSNVLAHRNLPVVVQAKLVTPNSDSL